MKVCRALFENNGIVRREKRNRFQLVKADMSSEQLAAVGRSYQLREERGIIRLQQVAEYAATMTCRCEYLFRRLQRLNFQVWHCDYCPCSLDKASSDGAQMIQLSACKALQAVRPTARAALRHCVPFPRAPHLPMLEPLKLWSGMPNAGR